MPIERNDSEKPREHRSHRDLIQDPNRLRDRIASSRDDEAVFNEESLLRENYSTSSSIAKFALIASTANIVSRRPMGKFGLEIANKLTSMINRSSQSAEKAFLRTAISSGRLRGTLSQEDINRLGKVAEDAPLMGHLQIFRDLDNALDTLNKLDLDNNAFASIGSDGSASLNPALRGYVDQMAESLKARHLSDYSSAEGIDQLTVDKLLAMAADNVTSPEITKLFGSEQLQKLIEARSVGLIQGAQRIDQRVFLEASSKNILDTRVLSGSFIGGMLERAAGQTQIPFMGFGLQAIFSPVVKHLFGKGDFSGIVRNPFSNNVDSRRVVVGGDLYRVNKNDQRFDFVASNFNVREKDGVGSAVLARRGQLKSQKRQSSENIEESSSSVFVQLLNAIQEDIGVGRRFATQEAAIKRVTVDLLKRRDAQKYIKGSLNPLNALEVEISKRAAAYDRSGNRLSLFQQAENRIPSEVHTDDSALGFFEKAKRDFLAGVLGDETQIQYAVRDPDTGEYLSAVIPVKGTSGSDFGFRITRPGEEVTSPVIRQLNAANDIPVQRTPLDSFAFESNIGTKLADVANFMTTRLNDLIGVTLGVGFRPTPGMFGFAGNMSKVFGLAAGGSVAIEGVKYLDYLSGLPTGGYKASNLLIDIFGVAKISAQFMREFVGLSPAARYMEDIMPGSIESSASDFVRTIAPIAIALKTLPGKTGVFAGAATSLLIGEFPFTGLSDTPKETIDKFYGEQLVPIRSGRYWMLGKQPFQGGKIQYFAPSMFARMRSEYKYTDTLYGSQQEYFKNVSFLPTPTNLFRVPELVGNILSPITNVPFIGQFLEHMPLVSSMFEPTGAEYLAQKHRFDRPYPTAFAIEQVSNRTVSDTALPGGSTASLRAYETPGESVLAMGKNLYPKRSELIPAVQKSMITRGVRQVSELSGIYKFALWDMTLRDSHPGTPELADPGFMNSITRSFYDESVGGLMGHTELLRRFVMSDYLRAQRQATNTIPNSMPSWLPGSRSSFVGKSAMGVFPGDRTFHIDFSTGDPYAKLPHGEFRLPGAARERMFRLHSGSPGVYDAVDRYMVLAEVAPNSEAFKHYQILVTSMLKSGSVDDYWTNKILKTKEHVKQKMQRYQTIARKFDGIKPQESKLLDQKEAEKSKEGIRTYYTMPEQAIGTAWEVFSHDVVKRIGISVPILGPIIANKMLPVRDELEAYLKREVYDTDEYDWTKPYATMIRPMHEQLKATDPFTAGIGGFISGNLIGANPLAKLVFSTAGSIYFAGSSSMRAIQTGKIEGGYVPKYVEERRHMQEYFDNLEYIKYRRLEKEARAKEMGDLTAHFSKLKKRTVASLDYSLGAKQFVRDALIALPSREKQLFISSTDAPLERQKEILQYVPEYLKPVYQAAWTKQGHNAYDYSNMRKAPDIRAAQYFMGHGMPDPTWAGFNPDVPMEAVKVKTMDSAWSSVSSDVHRAGVFGPTADKFRVEFPDPDLSVFNFYNSSGYSASNKQELEAQLMLNGITDYEIDENLGSGLEDIVNFDMTKPNSLAQFFSAAEEILRR